LKHFCLSTSTSTNPIYTVQNTPNAVYNCTDGDPRGNLGIEIFRSNECTLLTFQPFSTDSTPFDGVIIRQNFFLMDEYPATYRNVSEDPDIGLIVIGILCVLGLVSACFICRRRKIKRKDIVDDNSDSPPPYKR
jgi:hypothetical protein